jgi:hypothetical protein
MVALVVLFSDGLVPSWFRSPSSVTKRLEDLRMRMT